MSRTEDGSENGGAEAERPIGSFVEFVTHPLTAIALGLFAVAILAAPFYVRSLERGLLDNDLWLSICGPFGR